MEESYKAGDVVVITDKNFGCFYQNSLKAALVRRDEDGDWWAQFREQGNPAGSFDDSIGGEWCIGRAGVHFQLAEQH